VVLITPPNGSPFNKERKKRKKEKQQKKERKKEKHQKQERKASKTKNDIVTPIKGFLYFF